MSTAPETGPAAAFEPPPPGSRRRWALAGAAFAAAALAGALAWQWLGSPPAVPGGAAAPGGAGSGILAWLLDRQAAALDPASADAAERTFTVAPGESLPAVAARLEAEGLIRSASAFRLLARVRGLDRQVQAGRHVLRANMAAEEVLAGLLTGEAEATRLRVPEGWRAEEVADLVERHGLADRAEFLARVGDWPSDRPLLADRPPGAGLEGYLFPDTYEIEPGAGAEAVIERMLANLEARLEEVIGRSEATDLGIYGVLTLASIVEREAALPEERAKIARVFANRLAEPPYILNADPTLQYALGFQPESGTWWKRPLSAEDLAVDSAYNTYRQPGLPPGPIASAGLASIEAVLAPEPGPWMYFVADELACDGSHVFAATLDEHVRNIQTYQTGGCGR